MTSELPADYRPPHFSPSQTRPGADTLSQTPQYGMSHTMFRIKDPNVSIPFYVDTLGMTLVHRSDSDKGKFTNYFLHFTDPAAVPAEHAEKARWLWQQSGVLELCHNWGTETDPNFKHCSGNEKEHKGFGHICILVDDLARACDRFERLGVRFQKKPSEGTMKHIAFLLDPDGYWVEVITRGGGSSGQKDGS